MKVLVTGAAGSIGRTLVRGLPELGHEVRGLDLVDGPPDAFALGWATGDCLDPAVADEAVAGMDAVVDLAGNPNEASLPEASSRTSTRPAACSRRCSHMAWAGWRTPAATTPSDTLPTRTC